MKKTIYAFVALVIALTPMQAQKSNKQAEVKPEGYKFTTVVSLPATPVKNQSATGTCWCFATTSFMESELLRLGKGEYDLSEMFVVRKTYENRIYDNYLRQGRATSARAASLPHGSGYSMKTDSCRRKHIQESAMTQRHITTGNFRHMSMPLQPCPSK
ncbi:MAG: hypothetical protein MZV63_48305 [Marinilabiliales bacterium]|nr:hypothetical protein [Marinilabiliales bacterium]